MENNTETKGCAFEFVTAFSDAQEELYLFIMSLMGGDRDAAKDVLQDTNLRIWELRDSFSAKSIWRSHFTKSAIKMGKPRRFSNNTPTTRVAFMQTM